VKKELLQIRNISKSFEAQEVFRHLSFDVFVGEMVGILVPPLSGKTTLTNILKGEESFNGSAFFNGKPASSSLKAYNTSGEILCLTDESTLVPNLTIGENMLLRPTASMFKAVSRQLDLILMQDYLDELELPISASSLGRDASLFQCHAARIAYALSQGLKLVVLDDPCSYYEQEQLDMMEALIKKLLDRGVSVVCLFAAEFPFSIGLMDKLLIIEDYQKARTVFNPRLNWELKPPQFKSQISEQVLPEEETPKKQVLSMEFQLSDNGLPLSLQLSSGQALGISSSSTQRLHLFTDLFTDRKQSGLKKLSFLGEDISPQHFYAQCGADYILLTDNFAQSHIMDKQSILNNIYLPLCRSRQMKLLSFNNGYRKSLQQEIELRLGIPVYQQSKSAASLDLYLQQELVLFRVELQRPAFVVYSSSHTQIDHTSQDCLIAYFKRYLQAGVSIMIAAPKLERFSSIISDVYNLDEL
jgi:ABC-type sugar transport system ATPase subunit